MIAINPSSDVVADDYELILESFDNNSPIKSTLKSDTITISVKEKPIIIVEDTPSIDIQESEEKI